MLIFTALSYALRQFNNRTLTHSIYDKVSLAVYEDRWAQTLLPIVVMGKATHGCLYATQNYWHMRK